MIDSPLFLPSIPDHTGQDALAVAIVATPTTSRVSLQTAPPFALEPPSAADPGVACATALLVDGGIPSTAPAACPERAHRISLLTSTQLRSPVGRRCRHRRSNGRNEIAIKDHIIDRVVRFCGLRDEGKIKGLIYVPRI